MANMSKTATTTKSEEFTRFEQTLRNLIAVPKSEVDKQKAKYEREREKAGKRKRPAK
jgi:AAA15 family ATPase/GTPase